MKSTLPQLEHNEIRIRNLGNPYYLDVIVLS